ncbi:uncharacterized protein [Dermacentor albipictus]|uniref:uncharacterized protein isoform X2 n=1 Tax=Dermacentor albipictus TaxID=60249 RepID=UPI0038FC9F24
MRAIRKSRRQERRLCSALQTNQPVPGQIIHETQNRRNWLLARSSALLAFQEGAVVAQDAAPAPDSSDEDDAAQIKDGIDKLLARCMRAIRKSRRQERRICSALQTNQPVPGQIIHETQNRRNWLLARCSALLAFQEGAAVAQDVAPAADSSDEDDNAQIKDGIDRLLARCMRAIRKSRRQERRLCSALQTNQPVPGQIIHETQNRRNRLLARCNALLAFQDPSLVTRLEDAHAALGAWRSANRVARQSGKLSDIAVLAIRKAAGRQKVQQLQTAVQGMHDL